MTQLSRKKVLFIDRDGTIIKEAPPTYQLDCFNKLEFYPEVFRYLGKIAREFDYELVIVTNQDGLGTEAYPEKDFWPVHEFVMTAMQNEGVHFAKTFIDRTFPADNAPSRKPGTAMLTEYMNEEQYDLAHSYVIGDRLTDIELAKNLGCKGIWLNVDEALGANEIDSKEKELKQSSIDLTTESWKDIYDYLSGLD